MKYTDMFSTIETLIYGCFKQSEEINVPRKTPTYRLIDIEPCMRKIT